MRNTSRGKNWTRLGSLLGLLLASLSTACGGGGGGGGASAAQFIGTWQYTSGTRTFSCPTLNASDTDNLQGNTAFTAGTTAPLVWADGTCSYLFDIMGNVATARSGQTCNYSVDGIAVMSSANAITLTVTGTTAMLSGSWTENANIQGSVVTCTTSVTASLRKL